MIGYAAGTDATETRLNNVAMTPQSSNWVDPNLVWHNSGGSDILKTAPPQELFYQPTLHAFSLRKASSLCLQELEILHVAPHGQ